MGGRIIKKKLSEALQAKISRGGEVIIPPVMSQRTLRLRVIPYSGVGGEFLNTTGIS
jgi:hypothetical protein